MTRMRRHHIGLALAMALVTAPTEDRIANRLNPRLKGTPPNPNRKTKAEKKRDRKEKQHARTARLQTEAQAPVEGLGGQPAEGHAHRTDPAT